MNSNHIEITVPGSKSITQRAMVAAALAPGKSLVKGPLRSEDTLILRNALESMGITITDVGNDMAVTGGINRLHSPDSDIFMGNNGTGMRFMVAVASLPRGVTVLTGTDRMSERPIQPMLDALAGWGVEAETLLGTGCPPVRINAKGIRGGKTALKASKSSQFLSAMLLVAPYASDPAAIRLDGPLVSRPYVDITLSVMETFGVPVTEQDNTFFIPRGSYKPLEYDVEGDASSASYFWAAAAITGGSVTVKNIPEHPLQGDAAFADILGSMGCIVEKGPHGIRVKGPEPGHLKAIDIDMSRWPDIVPTLAVVAAFAKGTTRISNVEHLRIKETDRLRAMATELARIGVDIHEEQDGLVICEGKDYKGAEIQTYDDHRIAMCFAVASLKVPGIKVLDPGCVSKSFPDFWQIWSDLSQKLGT